MEMGFKVILVEGFEPDFEEDQGFFSAAEGG